MKKILFGLILCSLLFTKCGENDKPQQIMYAVEYTVELKDGPKKIIELIYFDADTPIGLFYIEDKNNDINRLKIYNIGGTRSKEICSTRFKISSYGISNWKLQEVKHKK